MARGGLVGCRIWGPVGWGQMPIRPVRFGRCRELSEDLAAFLCGHRNLRENWSKASWEVKYMHMSLPRERFAPFAATWPGMNGIEYCETLFTRLRNKKPVATEYSASRL